jgi:helix-turn-helix protein
MVVKSRTQLLQEFAEAPVDALFTSTTVAAIRHCSVANIERERWRGTGIPFRRIGGSIRYCKRDVLAWLNQYRAVHSTAEADAQSMRLREVCHE